MRHVQAEDDDSEPNDSEHDDDVGLLNDPYTPFENGVSLHLFK